MRRLHLITLLLVLMLSLSGCGDNSLEQFVDGVEETFEKAKESSALDLVGGEAYDTAKVEAYDEYAPWYKKGWDNFTSAFAATPWDDDREAKVAAAKNEKITKYVNDNADVKNYAEGKFVECIESDAEGIWSTVKQYAPILIIVLVILLLLVICVVVRKRGKAKPVRAVPSSSPTIIVDATPKAATGMGDVAVNYERLLGKMCAERGMDPDEMIAKYGNARAAVEAINLM